MYRLSVKSKR